MGIELAFAKLWRPMQKVTQRTEKKFRDSPFPFVRILFDCRTAALVAVSRPCRACASPIGSLGDFRYFTDFQPQREDAAPIPTSLGNPEPRRDYPMASVPFSPVRIRMQSDKSCTKILPSPMFPLRAPLIIASMVGLTNSSFTATSMRTFLSKFHELSPFVRSYWLVQVWNPAYASCPCSLRSSPPISSASLTRMPVVAFRMPNSTTEQTTQTTP